MGALYEDVENFFGDIFAWYGRFVARRPLLFVCVPLLTCGLLGLGLFNMDYETNIENLYTPVNSHAQRDRAVLRQLFGPYSAPDLFYPHQVVDGPAYGELIITVRTVDDERRGDSNATAEENTSVWTDRGKRNVLAPQVIHEVSSRCILSLSLSLARAFRP